MKYSVTRFKNLPTALRELKPFVHSGIHLQNGRPFKALGGMRSREAVANFLLCAVANYEYDAERFTFTSDPTGGDGAICNTDSGDTWLTEHVLLPRTAAIPASTKPTESLIIDAIQSKVAKGATYSRGKTLVVFIDCDAGVWYPQRVARLLTAPFHFDDIWIVNLTKVVDGYYEYGVSQLDALNSSASVWKVTIHPDFDDWDVVRIQ